MSTCDSAPPCLYGVAVHTVDVTATAPAKVNLCLHVGQLDSQGKHPLHTVFETLDIRDEVRLHCRVANDEDRRRQGFPFLVTTVTERHSDADRALVDLDVTRHLARRAVIAVWEACGGTIARADHAPASDVDTDGEIPSWVIDIHVTKRIPAAGGMAGGSADAAAALVAAARMTNLAQVLDLNAKEVGDLLDRLGRDLGADVPACLHGGIVEGNGYGDRVTPLPVERGGDIAHHWVLIVSPTGLSTPEVFRRFDAGRVPLSAPAIATADRHGGQPGRAPSELDQLARTWRNAGGEAVAHVLTNDLQHAAWELRPDLSPTERGRGVYREAFAQPGAILSGSGPTVAIACDSADAAVSLAQRLAAIDQAETRESEAVTILVATGMSRPATTDDTVSLEATTIEQWRRGTRGYAVVTAPGTFDNACAGSNPVDEGGGSSWHSR